MSVYWSSEIPIAGGVVFSQRVSVTALADGGYVVASIRPDGDFDAVFQIFNADGTVRGNSIVANVADDFFQEDPQVLALPNGEFAVLWTLGASIYVQKFTSTGERSGAEIVVPDVTGLPPFGVVLPDGSIAIAYPSPVT